MLLERNSNLRIPEKLLPLVTGDSMDRHIKLRFVQLKIYKSFLQLFPLIVGDSMDRHIELRFVQLKIYKYFLQHFLLVVGDSMDRHTKLRFVQMKIFFNTIVRLFFSILSLSISV